MERGRTRQTLNSHDVCITKIKNPSFDTFCAILDYDTILPYRKFSILLFLDIFSNRSIESITKEERSFR